MGYSARDVCEMSLWEFQSSVAGFIKANSSDGSNAGLTNKEIDELSEMLDQHKEMFGG